MTSVHELQLDTSEYFYSIKFLARKVTKCIAGKEVDPLSDNRINYCPDPLNHSHGRTRENSVRDP